MLVQLSPWETCRTSICVPKSSNSSRRRKRNFSDDYGEHVEDCPAFAASFISTATKRSLTKMRTHSAEFSDRLPLLALTADHHISVIGRKSKGEDPEPYREYSSLQYHSRPGDAGSFFAKPINGKAHPCDLPRIPAILDTKNDRVYAFQHGNRRLCCWNLWTGSGPDEKLTLKIDLQSPALSMNLLPIDKGIVYGTCQNGEVFVARVVNESGMLLTVEYLPSRQPKGAVPIGTVAEIFIDQSTSSGKKRKISDASGNLSLIFYQLFCDGLSFRVVRHSVSVSIGNAGIFLKNESLTQQAASIDLPQIDPHAIGHYEFTRAELLVSSSVTTPTVALLYTIGGITEQHRQHNNNSRYGTFCAILSLTTGTIEHAPIKLNPMANQFGLASESLLAVATTDSIYLYDLLTGAILQCKSIKQLITNNDGEWSMQTDTKHGILAVFYSKKDYLHVSFSVISMDSTRASLESVKLQSSVKVVGALLARSKKKKLTGTQKYCTSVLLPKDDDPSAEGSLSLRFAQFDVTVYKVLVALDECRKQLITDTESCSETSFYGTFNNCISTLMNETVQPVQVENDEVMPHNPQDPSGPDKDKKNDTYKSPTSVIAKVRNNNMLNGTVHQSIETNEDGIMPSWLPQAFIDGSVDIAMRAIRSEYKIDLTRKSLSRLSVEARLVLKRLLQTKRVSARSHFENSYSLEETDKKHPLVTALHSLGSRISDNPLSGVKMIAEMLQNCSDLSERQLVVMIDYIIRHSHGEDIAIAFGQSKDVRKHHPLKLLSRDFVSRLNKPPQSVENERSGTTETRTEGSLQDKIIVVGVEAVVQMIVCHSECNEAMLRVALSEELHSSGEAIILAGVLSKLLISSSSSLPMVNPRSSTFVPASCHWIVALTDAYREELEEAKTSSGENYLEFLVNSLRRTTRSTSAIISLKDDIGLAETTKKCVDYKNANVVVEEEKMNYQHMHSLKEEDLPGYSIDRMIF